MSTNFGPLEGGWLRVQIPDARLDAILLAYSSDEVVQSVQQSHEDFQALAGLPLLKLLEYGGNRDSFSVRPAT